MTGDFATQLGISLAVTATILMGPGIAVFFLKRRKRLARARRKSPLGFDLLRSPGHSLGERMDVLREDLDENLMRLVAIPPLTAGMYFAQQNMMGPERIGGGIAFIYASLVVAVIVYCVRKLLSTANELDKLKAGYDGEVAVGQQLDQLMRQGARVFHDFPADKFNIDHIVIASQGVFAVETKGFTKLREGDATANARVVFDGKCLSFPHGKTQEPVDQAERQARWLGDWLEKATGECVSVQPVLSLPGWYVDRQGRGKVWVFSGAALKSLLSLSRAELLPESALLRISHQIEGRCRTVGPMFEK